MRVGLPTGVVQAGVDETITGLWTFANVLGLLTDIIGERTGAAGVTIDGVLLRDTTISLLGFASAANRMFGSDVLGDIEERFRLHVGGTMQWGDGAGARDTDLFRASANLLATSDSFRVAGVLGLLTDIITERTAAAGVTIDGARLIDRALDVRDYPAVGSSVVVSAVTGDTDPRFFIQAGGALNWSSGVGAQDVVLQRDAASELGTPDDFNVGGALDLAGDIELSERNMTLSGGATDDDVPTGTETMQRLDPNATINVSGFAGGRQGRLMMIYNRTVSSLTVLHDNAGSVAANRVIGPSNANFLILRNAGVTLWYDSTLNRWLVMGRAT